MLTFCHAIATRTILIRGIDPLLRNQLFDTKTIRPRHSAASGIRPPIRQTSDKLEHQPAFLRLDNLGFDNSVESHVSAITKGPEIPLRHDAICSDEMQRKSGSGISPHQQYESHQKHGI
jgi:hypothetical protein